MNNSKFDLTSTLLNTFHKLKIMSEVAHDNGLTIYRFHRLVFDGGDSRLECCIWHEYFVLL